MKRKIISLCIIVAIVLGYIGTSKVLTNIKSVKYGMIDGTVGFTDSETDITDEVMASNGYVIAENSEYQMQLTTSADIRILHKKSGKIWDAVTADSKGNSKYVSSVILTYFSDSATENKFYSQESCVAKNQVKVYSADNGARVEYVFGDMGVEYVYPDMISRERMDKLLKKMEESDREYILRRYNLYILKEQDDENRKYLSDKYPRLEKEDLYILEDSAIKRTGPKIDSIFRSIGYTSEDQKKDNSGFETNEEKPKVFKVALEYKLTEAGFKVSVDTSECLFYQDYPLTKIQLLPYFDAFDSGDKGYLVLPSGSGAIANIGEKEFLEDTSVSLPIFGDNYTITGKLDGYEHQSTLPIFGQYKNGKGHLCIISDGAQQASVVSEKSSTYYSSASTVFELIDNETCVVGGKSLFWLFAPQVSEEMFGVEYILLPEANDSDAYSQMANIYRNRLKKDGIISKSNSVNPQFLAEFVHSINYDTTFLGCIPTKRDFALTSFLETSDITDELLNFVDSADLNLLLTGWNTKGLNKQVLNDISYSKVAGGKKGFADLQEKLAKKGVSYYSDFNFNLIKPFFGDKYSSSSSSARNINNSIVSLQKKSAKTYGYDKTKTQLISPNLFSEFENTDFNESLFDGGIGVNQFATFLYSDYKNGNIITRKDSLNKITNVLDSIKNNGNAIIGDTGNFYTLPYLSLINNLANASSGLNFYDKDIPLVQMVLHGCIDYVSTPFNDQENMKKELLKLIETGSGIHYKLTANSFEKLFETDFSYLYNTKYDYLKGDVENNYKFLAAALEGLGNKEILFHSYITDEVVCVSYENNIKIYINYSDSVYQEGSITVKPLSYLRVE